MVFIHFINGIYFIYEFLPRIFNSNGLLSMKFVLPYETATKEPMELAVINN